MTAADKMYAAQLRTLRKRARLTQVEFAELVSQVTGQRVAQDQISRWENHVQRIVYPRAICTVVRYELRRQELRRSRAKWLKRRSS